MTPSEVEREANLLMGVTAGGEILHNDSDGEFLIGRHLEGTNDVDVLLTTGNRKVALITFERLRYDEWGRSLSYVRLYRKKLVDGYWRYVEISPNDIAQAGS